MPILSEIQLLDPTALIELFVLDMTNLPGGTLSFFHAGTNQLSAPVVWKGISYTALPVEALGFDVTTRGSLPRPRIRMANVGGLLSALVMANNDLIGCKITRRRTFARYLDAVNFSSGVNPTADPTQQMLDDVWYVDRKMSENKYQVEWELASAFDLQGVMLPYRQVIQNSCPWAYRSPQCGYIGTAYFDGNDAPCVVGLDTCGKRLSSCRVRFVNVDIPFGGFPGALQYGN